MLIIVELKIEIKKPRRLSGAPCPSTSIKSESSANNQTKPTTTKHTTTTTKPTTTVLDANLYSAQICSGSSPPPKRSSTRSSLSLHPLFHLPPLLIALLLVG